MDPSSNVSRGHETSHGEGELYNVNYGDQQAVRIRARDSQRLSEQTKFDGKSGFSISSRDVEGRERDRDTSLTGMAVMDSVQSCTLLVLVRQEEGGAKTRGGVNA